MGNRSYLYLCTNGDYSQIAEAKNNIPVLWKLLLVNGQSHEAIRDQRVFGDNNTHNLAVSLREAVERVGPLLDFVANHPLANHIPQLPRYAVAVNSYLLELLSVHGDDAFLSADFDEMDGLEEKSDAYHSARSAAFLALWQLVETAIQNEDWPDFDVALASPPWIAANWSLDWQQWQWHFGLSSFSHPYFEDYHEIREESFEEFNVHYQPETDDDEPYDEFRLSRFPFAEFGAYGLRRGPGEDAPIIVPARYQAFCNVDEEDGVCDYLLAYQENDLWGLVDTRSCPAEFLTPACYDELWAFDENYAPFQLGDRFGFIGVDGQRLGSQLFEDVSSFFGGFSIVTENGLQGLLRSDGQWQIRPRYTEMEWVTEVNGQSFCKVQMASGWGLLNAQGDQVLSCQYQSLEWASELEGWQLTQDGLHHLLKPDLQPWFGPTTYQVKSRFNHRNGNSYVELFCIQEQGLYGLLDGDGQVIVSCVYEALEEVDVLWDCPAMFVVQKEGLSSLIDQHGVLLLPLAEQEFEPFYLVQPGLSRELQQQPLLRISQTVDDETRLGVWKVGSYDLLIPCQYSGLLIAQPISKGQDYVFVTERSARPEQQESDETDYMGILKSDGSALFEENYSWIALAVDLESRVLPVSLVIQEVEYQWQAGKSIQAWHNDQDTLKWLSADGCVDDHETYLRKRYASGDVKAGLMLAEALSPGGDLTENTQEALDIYRDIAAKIGNNKDQRAQALYQQATLLRDLRQGSETDTEALALLKNALAICDDETLKGKIYCDLGFQYGNGVGVEANPQEGLRYAKLGSECGNITASHNLGLIYLHATGTDLDLNRALAAFELCSGQGGNADAWIGQVLMQKAAIEADEKGYQRAAYHFRKALKQEQAPDFARELLLQLGQEQKIKMSDSELLSLEKPLITAQSSEEEQNISPETSRAPLKKRLLHMLLYILFFAGIAWLLRDHYWLRLIPAIIGGHLCGKVWRS